MRERFETLNKAAATELEERAAAAAAAEAAEAQAAAEAEAEAVAALAAAEAEAAEAAAATAADAAAVNDDGEQVAGDVVTTDAADTVQQPDGAGSAAPTGGDTAEDADLDLEEAHI